MLANIRPEFNFSASNNLILDGFLDSFDIVALVSMLEEKYSIKIDGLDIVPENFSDLDRIAALVAKCRT
jgi:acyl carrier protein